MGALVLFDDHFPVEVRERVIDCTGCRAPCCKQFKVPLTPIESRTLPMDPEEWRGGAAILAKKPDGSCIYLTPANRCGIWARRPLTCIEYTCRGDRRVSGRA